MVDVDLADDDMEDEDDVQGSLVEVLVNFRPNHYQYIDDVDTKPPRKWCAFLYPTKLLKEYNKLVQTEKVECYVITERGNPCKGQLGCRAKSYIKKDERLGIYAGKVEVNNENNKSKYVAVISTNTKSKRLKMCVDGAKTCNVFAFMNDSRGMSDKTCNVRFHAYAANNAVFDDIGLPIHPVVATRDINPGEDILVSYGDTYWDNHTESKTKHTQDKRTQDGFPSDREQISMLLWDDIEIDDLRVLCKQIKMRNVKVHLYQKDDADRACYLAYCTQRIEVGEVVGILGGRVLEEAEASNQDPTACIYEPAGCKLAIEAENECRCCT